MAANAAVVLTLHDQNNIVAENKLKEEEAIAAIKKASKDTPPSQRVAYFSLLRYADRVDIMYMIAGTIGCMLNGAAMPVFTIIFGDVLNNAGSNQADLSTLNSQIRNTVPNFVYLGMVSFVGAYCQGYFWPTAAVRQVNRIRAIYLRQVLQQEIGFFDTTATSGFLMQGLNEDCITIQTAIGEKMAMFLYFSSTFISGTIIALVRGWDMALVVLSLLPLLGGAGFSVMYLSSRLTGTINTAYAEANSLAQQSLSNVRTVYAFNGEERTLQDFDAALEVPTKVGIKAGFLAGSTLGFINCVAFMCYSLALWYGGQRVIAGAYNGGNVMTVLFSSLIGGFALGQAAPNIQYFQQGQVSGGRLFEILKRSSNIDPDADGETLANVEGSIELKDVVFAYPSRTDKPVFNGFSLTVASGSTVALVGESGSGKSTIIQLVERFYDPQQGSILIDGHDVRSLQLRWLRSQIGLVSQEPTLFATTIRENILFGKPGSTQQEVEDAARAANAHSFISALPQGYDTFVGEKGVQMSGGQKQRIAISRAILKNPRILLLDEATSALDAESESVVQDALDKLMIGRTTVVVAHRLSTVKDADVIAVVKGGVIVEQGSHTELLSLGGAYSTLVHIQQQSTESNAAASGTGFSSKKSSFATLPFFSNTPDEEEKEKEQQQSLTVDTALDTLAKGRAAVRPVNMGIAAPVMGPQRMASGWRRFVSMRNKNNNADAVADSSLTTSTGSKSTTTKTTTKKKGKKGGGEDDEGPPVKAGIGRIAALNKPEFPYLIGGVIGSASMGMIFPVFALALSTLIAVFYLPVSEISSGTRTWSLVFMGLGFIALIASFVQSFCFNVMGQRLGRRVRVMMMRALLRQEVGWFDDERNSSGVLTSKLSADALAVKGQFGDTMGLLTQNLVTLIAGYIIAAVNSWRITLVTSATFPLLIGAAYVQNSMMLTASSGEDEKFAIANATASEAFSSARTVTAFGMENQVAKLYERSLAEPTGDAKKRANYAGLGFGVSQFVMFSVYAMAFWYMGLEISRGYSSFESAFKAFLALFMAAIGMAQAQVYFPDVAKGKLATQRVFSVVDRQPLIDASDPSGIRPVSCSGQVELRAVTFSYPQRPDAPVFSNFNLSVPAGSTVALVGESGSGKSTVVQLIERFYDPQQGQVCVDGVDIKTLDLHWLRSKIALVSQEPVLFSLSVADNIRYGNPTATMEDVMAAAMAANAHTFIEALPEGYHTNLGEGEIQLSGGQKQRVCIARALVKDAPLLLLDEATSALDAESENVVQEALERLMEGRTTIIIAHRLSTIKDADSIAVVYKGKLVEQGTHSELLGAGGSYAKLVAHQL